MITFDLDDIQCAFANLEMSIRTFDRYDLAVTIYYNGSIDRLVAITPRRNREKARKFGEVWHGGGRTLKEAIVRAVEDVTSELGPIP